MEVVKGWAAKVGGKSGLEIRNLGAVTAKPKLAGVKERTTSIAAACALASAEQSLINTSVYWYSALPDISWIRMLRPFI